SLRPRPAAVQVLETASFLGGGRAGANEAHMTLQDIKELRKLINAAAADDFADESDPRVAGRFENRSVHFVERFEFDAKLLGVVDHGPELVHRESPAIKAAALLLEEHRPRRSEFDEDGRGQHDE